MAIVYVGGTSGVGTAATYAVSLSGTLTGGIASSPSEGDIVVVFSGFGNAGAADTSCSGNNSGAYTLVPGTSQYHQNDTWDAEFAGYYFIQGATVDTSLTIGRVANGAYGGAAVVQVWRGVDTTTPFDVAATVAGAGNTGLINPPLITPTTAGTVILAGGTGTQTTAGSAFVVSSNMAGPSVTVKGDGTTSDTGTCIASHEWTTGSFTPNVVTGGAVSTNCAWRAMTLALREAVVVVNGTASGDLSSSNLTAPDSAATGGASASVSLSAITQTAPTATATGTAEANGSVSALTLTAPTGEATSVVIVNASASGSLASVALTAVSATATGGAGATASLAAVIQTAPTATATGTAAASGAGATATLTAPTSAATGTAAASGSLQGISLTAPTGSASSLSVVNGNASASVAGISLTAATAQAVADAQAVAVFASLQINPATGAAYGTANASGLLAGIVLTGITATARGTDPSVPEPGAMVGGRTQTSGNRADRFGTDRAAQLGGTRYTTANTTRPARDARTTR